MLSVKLSGLICLPPLRVQTCPVRLDRGRLELVSEEAKADRARLQQERIRGTGGSFLLPSQLSDTRKKVT